MNEIILAGKTFSEWLSELNIFSGVDFSVLYSWLPGDIASVCTAIISFLFVLAVLGLIRRFLLR